MFYFKNGREYVSSNDFKLLTDEASKIDVAYTPTNYITIEFTNRLKAAAGKAEYKNSNYTIKLSVDYYKQFGIDRSIKTLKHEFAHIIQHTKYKKMDHGTYFKKLCHELGGSMNPTMAGYSYSASACNEYIKPVKSVIYVYTCSGCGKKMTYRKRMTEKIRTSNRHRCTTCSTPVSKFTETIIHN